MTAVQHPIAPRRANTRGKPQKMDCRLVASGEAGGHTFQENIQEVF
jgi:hypothetical protein